MMGVRAKAFRQLYACGCLAWAWIAMRRYRALRQIPRGVMSGYPASDYALNQIIIRSAINRCGEGLTAGDTRAIYERLTWPPIGPPLPLPVPQSRWQQQAAIGRAWATLYSYLSEVEQDQLRDCGYLEIVSKLTPNRVYHITAVDGPVLVWDSGKQTLHICARPEDSSVPWPDVMLAYRLGLRADEARWLETANEWPAPEVNRDVDRDVARVNAIGDACRGRIDWGAELEQDESWSGRWLYDVYMSAQIPITESERICRQLHGEPNIVGVNANTDEGVERNSAG